MGTSASATVSAGRAIDLTCSPNPEPNPDTGNQPAFNPSSSTSMMPSQNAGMPSPISGIVRITLSAGLFGRLAAHTASGTLISTANSTPATISHSVGARSLPTSDETLVLVW